MPECLFLYIRIGWLFSHVIFANCLIPLVFIGQAVIFVPFLYSSISQFFKWLFLDFFFFFCKSICWKRALALIRLDSAVCLNWLFSHRLDSMSYPHELLDFPFIRVLGVVFWLGFCIYVNLMSLMHVEYMYIYIRRTEALVF